LRVKEFDYRASSSTTLASICAEADNRLLSRVTGNTQHLLHNLLPPRTDSQLSTTRSYLCA